MSTLIFDIETIPDADSGRRLHDFKDLSDADVVRALEQLQYQKNGSTFMPHYLHKIIVISLIHISEQDIKICSLKGEEDEIVKQFFKGLAKYTPQLVSWNGKRFDLPVLHYRSLLHKVAAPEYWEIGDNINNFRYNNYFNRYHWRHLDLMDVLAGYDTYAAAPLDKISKLIGTPGKGGVDGSQVWDFYQQGKLDEIVNYCETDVVNTYLVYLRFQLIRGKLTHQKHDDHCQQLYQLLENYQHLQHFIE
ncbi:MAG: 3'-5' exonuclease [Chromatiales bacterium]|nr:3'-5' exonuclease [Chromatiales bacterium]